MEDIMPSFRKTLLSATIAVAIAAFGVHAHAQMLAPWFKDSVGMSAEDLEKMKGALKAAVDQKKPGATADWVSSSGRAGHVEVLELFEKDGMECQSVKHDFTAGGGRTYILPLCKVADGSWKIAF
jgi:surface antigen